MKKILKLNTVLLALTTLFFCTICAHAQNAQQSIQFSVAANLGIPTSMGLSFAYGADLQADFATASSIKITGSLGYEGLKLKGIDRSTYFIPLLGGVKFDLGSDKLYAHAQLGFAYARDGSGFAYAPSIGYIFSPEWDASLKYLAYHASYGTTGSVNLRIGYSF